MTEKLEEVNQTNGHQYSLFLGCVIPNRYPMIEKATRVVMDHIGVNLIDMNGASCCPAPGVFRSIDNHVWHVIGSRNLSIAEQNGADLLTLCNGCYGTLKEIDTNMKKPGEMRDLVNGNLREVGREYKGKIEVKQITEALYFDLGLEKLKQFIKYELDIPVAVHYGCHLGSPADKRPFGGPDKLGFFDELVEITGSQSLEYREKTMCCGAGGGLRASFRDTSLEFTHAKVKNMRDAGAEAIIVCCPFCALQFDLGQMEMNNRELSILDPDEEPYHIPVIFITQLLGLVMGIDPKELGLIRDMEFPGTPPFTQIHTFVEKAVSQIEKQKEDAN